jgi:DNA-binding transcriptional MerR regulator
MSKQFATAKDVIKVLGVSRSQLIYWTRKAALVEPCQRLAKTNLYNLENILDLALVKVLFTNGLTIEKIAMIFKAFQNRLRSPRGTMGHKMTRDSRKYYISTPWSFWAVYFNRTHKYPKWKQHLNIILRPNGVYLYLDFGATKPFFFVTKVDTEFAGEYILPSSAESGIRMRISLDIPLSDIVEPVMAFMDEKSEK